MTFRPGAKLDPGRGLDERRGGTRGRMTAIVDGKYAHVPLPEAGHSRKVDVDTMYDLDRFRPQYHNRLGRPLLLGASLGTSVAEAALVG